MASRAEKAWHNKNWARYILLHAPAHRWRALWRVAVALYPSPDLADLFRHVWVDSEVIWSEEGVVSRLIRLVAEDDKIRRRLFTDTDRARFDALADRFKIYRGAKEWNHSGRSWTRDMDSAVYFANHHYEDGAPCAVPPSEMGVVMEKTICKSAVLFYTNERTEEEIVLFRPAKGLRSHEGKVWVARATEIPEIFEAELHRQQKYLTPDQIRWFQIELAPMKLAGVSAVAAS